MMKVGIIGTGQWCLALIKILINVKIIVKTRNLKNVSQNFLNKNNIKLTERFEDIIECEYIFFANPSQKTRFNLEQLPQNTKSTFIICCKGVEKKTNKLMSEVLKEFFPKNYFAILSGPNFASEVLKGLPSASVLSSENNNILKKIAKIISQEKFRTYFNNDIIGTQIGGAMKNVIAIACGIIIGSGLGHNASAAIITRGLYEIKELGFKMGAKKITFCGLSGIGDLTLTCSSLKSRNTKLGYMLAKKKKPNHVLFEGKESCYSICELGKKYKVELPICNVIKEIFDGKDLNEITSKLLSRPLQYEK